MISLIAVLVSSHIMTVMTATQFVVCDVEMHRTQSEFEDQLVFKVFIFQFVNFYSFIVYIGFFKGKYVNVTSRRTLVRVLSTYVRYLY